MLLRYGDVNACDTANLVGNALIAACAFSEPLPRVPQRDSFKTIKLLISKGIDVNATAPGSLSNALVAATRRGRLDIVELLLDSDADIDMKDESNGTTLEVAKRLGHIEISQLLQSRGAR